MEGVKGVGYQLITIIVKISQRIHQILNVKFTGTLQRVQTNFNRSLISLSFRYADVRSKTL